MAGALGQPGSVADFQRAAAGFRNARDEREVLLMLLHGAVSATRATRGLVHLLRPPINFLVTSYAHGGLEASLGQVVHGHDPAYTLARSGQRLSGAPTDGLAERLLAARLGDEQLAGVVMVPVTFGTELHAMLELGRDDRRFRVSDVDELRSSARSRSHDSTSSSANATRRRVGAVDGSARPAHPLTCVWTQKADGPELLAPGRWGS